MKYVLHPILYLLFLIPCVAMSQSNGPNEFPELIMTKIPGAPKLAKPVLITGKDSKPLISQGFGTAAPAFWDWNGDGLKDLLIGEFNSGVELGRVTGNFIRVYLNTGTETQPVFGSRFDYAKPPYELPINGTPYSVDQYCCIGFTPQFTDLNADGYTDMVTGQYFGEVSWFRGSEKGFLPGEFLPQEGNPRDTDSKFFIQNQSYWLYSSASFGDLTSDGRYDLVVGGMELRLSKNVGTRPEPRFEKRDLLLDIHGKPLKVYQYTAEDSARIYKSELSLTGDYKTSPIVTDWDNDGVLDLLVTNSYDQKRKAAVDFYRGVKVGKEHRFEPGVPLFITANNAKALPGISPFVFVTDWNNDGINDLLIGISVVLIQDKFNSFFSWNWEKETGLEGIGHDPGLLKPFVPESSIQSMISKAKLPPDVSGEDFITMVHRGYVYVMLGSKDETATVNQKTKRK